MPKKIIFIEAVRFVSENWAAIRMADAKAKKGRDFYELLGLEKTANQGQIKHAYRFKFTYLTLPPLTLNFPESWQ